jgi:hypothetical protein
MLPKLNTFADSVSEGSLALAFVSSSAGFVAVVSAHPDAVFVALPVGVADATVVSDGPGPDLADFEFLAAHLCTVAASGFDNFVGVDGAAVAAISLTAARRAFVTADLVSSAAEADTFGAGSADDSSFADDSSTSDSSTSDDFFLVGFAAV